MPFKSPSDSPTFEQVCEALAMMGLSRVIAAPVVTHACKAAGIAADQLAPEQVQSLGPVLERSLRMYLGEQQVSEALKRIYRVSSSDTRPATREALRALAATRTPKS